MTRTPGDSGDSASIEISIESIEDPGGDDATPLPRAVPFHVAEPTTASIRRLVAEPSDLPVSEDADTRPGNEDGVLPEVAGLASAARRISAELGVAIEDDPIITQRIPRLDPLATFDELDDDALLTPAMIQRPEPVEAADEPAARTASQAVIAGRFFAPLPAERRGPVLDRFTPRTVARGAIVIRQGETGHPLVLVAHGRLDVRAELATGELIQITSIAAGEFVGEAALLARTPASAHVIAVTDAELLLLAPNDLYELAGAFPALWAELKDVAERRTREHDRRIKKR